MPCEPPNIFSGQTQRGGFEFDVDPQSEFILPRQIRGVRASFLLWPPDILV